MTFYLARAKLVDLAEKFFVKEPELWASSTLLYSSILTDTVADQRPNNEDLGRLVMLKWTLGLSSHEVASCHQRVGFGGVWRPLSSGFKMCLYVFSCVFQSSRYLRGAAVVRDDRTFVLELWAVISLCRFHVREQRRPTGSSQATAVSDGRLCCFADLLSLSRLENIENWLDNKTE